MRELVDALSRVGLSVRDRDGALMIDGVSVEVDVERKAVMTPTMARGLRSPPKGVLGVVVADRISDEARRELAARGWGWVDRRGHVRVWSEGLRIATDIEPLKRTPANARFGSVFPPVGIEVSLALLKEPERDWTVKDLAAALNRARSGVSERLSALREAGLVDRRNRPMLPELFWELVEPWSEPPFGLSSFPGLDGPFEDLSWLRVTDWVLTDTQAALFLGAPVLASSEGPPDFYVPEPSIVDVAISHLGPSRGAPAATVRASRYTGVNESQPFRMTPSGLRVAHPVIVALDLAHDRARGREIVEAWDPSPLGVQRVW